MSISLLLVGTGFIILIIRWFLFKNLDRYIRIYLLKTRTKHLNLLMKYITRLGARDIAMGILVLIPNDKARLGAFLAILTGMSIGQILNIIIGQKRPPGQITYNKFTNKSKYHAFASGHTIGAFAFSTLLAHYYTNYNILLYFFAFIVSISRIYNDKHWFSNIISGAIIGHLAGKLVISFY